MPSAIQLSHASKHYQVGRTRFDALLPTDLTVGQGEYVGLVGPSGSGKSTLLNLVAGIDRPSAGQVRIAGHDITVMKESQLASFRGREIGIVFQFFQLIPTLSVLENLVLAMDLVGAVPQRQRRARALALLEDVGVENHAHKLPAELSGGEQQRVAIARSLANNPPILVADEPTGNLDSANSEMIEGIFRDCAARGHTVIVATHETARLDRFGRLLKLADGALVTDEAQNGAVAAVAERIS
jgi:putative ABC transport system ATP-binding protein